MVRIVECLRHLPMNVTIATDQIEILGLGEEMGQDTGIQGEFIHCFDRELRTGGVVTRRGDVQRGNDNRIHLGEEQPILVMLQIQSNVVNSSAVGDEMRRFLFGVSE